MDGWLPSKGNKMISLGCRDFRGCERADIVLTPFALVAGKNGAGKSSLGQATAAALCADPLPLSGMPKTAAGLLVKSGSNTARMTLRGESGTARIDWPSCAVMAEGTPPQASRWAAGVDRVSALSPRDRARVIGEYLHSDPTREDLKSALEDVELKGEPVLDAVCQLVSDHGWDGAHTLRKEKGAELKGQWRQVAGVNYGSRVAVSWLPPDWVKFNTDEVNLHKATENDLAAAIPLAQAAHNKAIADAAVSGAARDRLQAEADTVEARKDALRDAEAETERVAAELARVQNERAGLPTGNLDPGLPCPHCGALVVIRQIDLATRVLEPIEDVQVTAAELKQRRMAIADADGIISNLTAALRDADRAVDRARVDMQVALNAKVRVEAMPPASSGSDVEAAAADLDRARRRLAAWRQKREAGEIQTRIAGNDLVLGILAPDGLRAKKLAHVLDLFNLAQLGRLSLAAGWNNVTIDPEMTLAYGGRPFALLSSSEQYRVNAVLQLAMAHLDKSAMVVLDAADILDGGARTQLFAMLEEAGLPALVCMTLTRRDQMPDLAHLGFGESYWIESGVAQTLNPPAEAAA
jgi:hypothetical protein